MRRLILLTVFGVVSVQAATAATTPDAADAGKKVCRLEEVTGSIMMHSICHTKEEWVEVDKQNARGVGRLLGRDQSPAGGASASRDAVSRGK